MKDAFGYLARIFSLSPDFYAPMTSVRVPYVAKTALVGCSGKVAGLHTHSEATWEKQKRG
jgi:hypothetical protein